MLITKYGSVRITVIIFIKEDFNLKKQTRKLLSTVLSATTVMSMLTFMPANVATVSAYEENEENLFGAVKNENGTSFMYATGDLTLENELPEDVTRIETIGDYYEVSDTNPKDGASSSLPESVDNSQSHSTLVNSLCILTTSYHLFKIKQCFIITFKASIGKTHVIS